MVSAYPLSKTYSRHTQTSQLIGGALKNMATDVHEYRRDRSRSPVYKGYRNRSKSRSPERNSRGDGLLPTPSTKYEHSGLRSRSRERYNGYFEGLSKYSESSTGLICHLPVGIMVAIMAMGEERWTRRNKQRSMPRNAKRGRR